MANAAAATGQKGKSKYIHFAIVLAFMFLFRFIPPFGTITPYGMAVIGIFIGLIYGWSVDADNLIWTSLLALVALGVTDFGSAGTALAQAFGNESVVLMLLGMFFLGMLQDSHLIRSRPPMASDGVHHLDPRLSDYLGQPDHGRPDHVRHLSVDLRAGGLQEGRPLPGHGADGIHDHVQLGFLSLPVPRLVPTWAAGSSPRR